jgi:zinc and cadmium transporter
MRTKQLKKMIFILVSFAVGALFGNAFFMLIPESFHQIVDGQTIGITGDFGINCNVCSRKIYSLASQSQCNRRRSKQHLLGYISLITDSLHNFTDGVLIAAAWMVSPRGWYCNHTGCNCARNTQEISDFGVLLHAGFSKRKALFLNFIAASSAILGGVLTLTLGSVSEKILTYILPFAAGGFIYLAGSDLIPELNRERSVKKSMIQFAAIVAGLALMFYISLNHEHHHAEPVDNQIEMHDHSEHDHSEHDHNH